ncbi:glycosyltransferase family 4 protein [Eggerthella timonensis]|uniref:glycosyltransferase family 4 protein n=1 Tax=Eggerthella timonensis TaxID=1871008 RepID=UPI000C7930D6|nr:glycosyltransferase family 1 protein [Eggerthella timonensis]
MRKDSKRHSSEEVSSSVKYALNGRFLSRQMTGVDRYAYELIRELARGEEAWRFCLAVPLGVDVPPEFAGIAVVVVGKLNGAMWEQIDFARFAKKRKLTPVNLCNAAPVLGPGIVCIHDMAVRAHPSFYSLRFRLWYRLLFACNVRNAKAIATVTDFSRREIEKYYPAAKGRAQIVPDAWQHVERVKADEGAFSKHPALRKGSYYFAMSSLAPNKNLKWLVETARLNPQETIAVAGGINRKVFGEHSIPEAENVVYLGYVSDGEAKALMQHCKGFLFPTFYEGFGIPPMEALACGAQAAVSDNPCMREVYERSVHCINPNVPCSSLSALFGKQTGASDVVLGRYSWEKSARELIALIEKSNLV